MWRFIKGTRPGDVYFNILCIFCLKFSLQQIAIHIYYQIKIACNRPGVVVVSKHYSFKQKNSCSSTLTMLSLHDIFDKIKTKFQELECQWTGQMEEYTKNKNYPPRSFSSSIKSLSVHSDCRIQGLIFQNFHGGGMPPQHVR